LYDGTTLIGTTSANAAGAWNYTLGVLANGAHSVTATATDAASNTGKASAALKFTVDTVAPVAPTALADNAIVGGYVNAARDKASQTLTGTAEARSTVTIYDGTLLLGTVTANAAGSWAYTLGVLADGAHSLTAKATDAAGNVSAASAALAFTVDTVAPAVPVVSDIAYDATHNLATITGQTEANALVTVFDNGVVIGTTTANASGAWSFAAGTTGATTTHKYTETSTDAAGNTSKSAGSAIFSTTSGAKLTGGTGNDVLIGAPGDTLTGGAGNDTFVFHAGFGKETVADFTAPTATLAGDVLQFDTSVFADWAHLLGATKQVGSDLTITLDANDIVTLKNVSLASFTQASARFSGAGLSN